MKRYVHARDVVADSFTIIFQIETIKIDSLLLLVLHLFLLCQVFFTDFFGHFAYVWVLHTLNKALRLVGLRTFGVRYGAICGLQAFRRFANRILLLYLTKIKLAGGFVAGPFGVGWRHLLLVFRKLIILALSICSVFRSKLIIDLMLQALFQIGV